MAIESVEYSYSEKDTAVSVVYIEDGVEKTVSVNTVIVNSVVDSVATESAIVLAVYGSETPPSIPLPADE